MKNAEQLKAIYADKSFKDRQVARYSDGGSYSLYAAYNANTPVSAGSPPAGATVTQGPSNPNAGLNEVQTTAQYENAQGQPISEAQYAAQQNQAIVPSSGAGAPAGQGGSNTGGLGGLASSIGNSNLLPAIVGILTAAGHFAQSKGAATLPAMPGTPGFTGSGPLPALPGANGSNGFGPAGGYNFGNYSGAPTPGLGYAPRTQAPAMPTSSYYTYGQGPEHQFFTPVNPTTGVAPPNSSGATPPPGQKKGGRVKKYAGGGDVPTNWGGIAMLGGAALAAHEAAKDDGGMTVGQAWDNIKNSDNPVSEGLSRAADWATNSPAYRYNPNGVKKNAMGGMQQNPILGAQQPAAMARPAVIPNQRPVAPQMPARPAPAPTMPVARPGMPAAQPVISPRPMMRAAGGSSDSTGYANTMGQWMPPAAGGPAQSNVTGTPARGALSDVIPHRTMVGHAQGGAMPQGNGAPTVSRHVRGPGDGTSDSIPARLANGEYVLSADVVSGLGNGDNGSGAKRLDAFVHNVRVHKSQNASQGKLPADAKPIHQYMGPESGTLNMEPK